MKTKELITGIFLLCVSFCYAQPSASKQLEYHKRTLKNTAYIFEGDVTDQKGYYGKNKEILTCSIMHITKIYKGSPEVKLGTIEIITTGGHIGNTPYLEPADGGFGEPTIGHCIIFCKNVYLSMVADSEFKTDNTIILTRMNCDRPIEFSGKITIKGKTFPAQNYAAKWDYTTYSTVDSVYSFFTENGVTVQEEVKENK